MDYCRHKHSIIPSEKLQRDRMATILTLYRNEKQVLETQALIRLLDSLPDHVQQSIKMMIVSASAQHQEELASHVLVTKEA